MSSFTIRPAAPRDFEAVESILREAELPLDGLSEQFGDCYVVAVSDDAIVGVEGIEVHGDDGLLRSAAIASAWRGHGVGAALTRDRIEWAVRRGLRSLYLLTTTAGDYFTRFGFTRVERQSAPEAIRRSQQFSECCCSSGLAMVLPLRDYTKEMSLTQEVATMLGVREAPVTGSREGA